MYYLYFLNLYDSICKFGVTTKLNKRLYKHNRNHGIKEICAIYELKNTKIGKKNLLYEAERYLKSFVYVFDKDTFQEKYGDIRYETEIFELIKYNDYIQIFENNLKTLFVNSRIIGHDFIYNKLSRNEIISITNNKYKVINSKHIEQNFEKATCTENCSIKIIFLMETISQIKKEYRELEECNEQLKEKMEKIQKEKDEMINFANTSPTNNIEPIYKMNDFLQTDMDYILKNKEEIYKIIKESAPDVKIIKSKIIELIYFKYELNRNVYATLIRKNYVHILNNDFVWIEEDRHKVLSLIHFMISRLLRCISQDSETPSEIKQKASIFFDYCISVRSDDLTMRILYQNRHIPIDFHKHTNNYTAQYSGPEFHYQY